MKKNQWMFVSFFVVFFGLFLIYPVFFISKGAFFSKGQFSFVFFRDFFDNPTLMRSVAHSFWLGIATTLVSLVVSIPCAYASAYWRFRGKGIIQSLFLLPMIMPPFVGAIGMRQLFGKFGSINLVLMNMGWMSTPIDWFGGASFWGVVILEVLHLYPIMYLNLTSSLANIDPSMREAASNVGASGYQSFKSIIAPLMTPGLFAGAIIVFIWAFTDLGTPLMFGYRDVASVKIFEMCNEVGENPMGYVLVVIVLLVTVASFWMSKVVTGSKTYSMLSKGSAASREKSISLIRTLCVYGMFGAIILAAVLPHIGVVLNSIRDKWFMTILPETYTFQHYVNVVEHPLTHSSIHNSIFYSSVATVIDVCLGIWIGFVLVRKKIFGRHVMDAIVMLPLALPGIVIAFGYIGAFSGWDHMLNSGVEWGMRALGIGGDVPTIRLFDPKYNPTLLLIVAYAIRRLPFVVRAACSGFQQLNVALEEASANVGASPIKTLRSISIPLIGSNLMAGAILAFSLAMLEVSDSLLLAFKEEYYPITKAIYTLFYRLGDGPSLASAMGVWAMALLMLTLGITGVFIGKKMGEFFKA